MFDRLLAPHSVGSSRARRPRLVGLLAALLLAPAIAAAQQQGADQQAAPPPNQQNQQNQPGQSAALTEGPAPTVPRPVLASLLTNTGQSSALIRSFLAGEGGDPDTISRRAVDLVNALKASGLVTDPALVAVAAQRVAKAASDTLGSAPILQLRVDKSFRAPPGLKAFDFGPPDKAPVSGFQRVLPNDPMLAGQVRGLRRPGDEAGLLSGGISGVKKLSINLPDGEYRITLITEAVGDAALTLAPFGNTIDANGQDVRIMETPPDHWSNMAVLSNQGLSGAANAEGGGGAVTLVVHVVGGKLNLGFQFDGASRLLQTYLTGMVVEPVSQPSVFARTPDAPPLQPDTENRLRQETKLLAALVQAAQPSAGQPLVPAQDNRPEASPS